ncbi:MAG: Crp/Fnr family transcriptional regulator [Chitinophagales bacterium]|nr:Crp/Fnr family transcriptional regulator [Chitinophagales bacterium]
MNQQRVNLSQFAFCKDESLQKELISCATMMNYPANDILQGYDKNVRCLFLIMEGTVAVYREDGEGKEYHLMYNKKGESPNIAHIYANPESLSDIKIVAVEPVEAMLIDKGKVPYLLNNFPDFQQFLLQNFVNQYSKLIGITDSASFYNLETRLVEYLEKTCEVRSDHQLCMSHHEIANALNTSREVVSRILKKLEAEGRLKLHRNQVEMLCYQNVNPLFCKHICDKSH